MDKRGEDIDKIKYLILKLRAITLAVQIIPFVYVGVYIFSMSSYLIFQEAVLNVLDALFYTSPLIVAAFLIESKILKLCVWHKIACSLPLIPQIIVLIDSFIVELTETEAIIVILAPIVMSVLLLIAAYNVFLK